MNNDYEMDGASFSSRSETDFLSFLNEREDNAQWLEEEIKVMKLKVQDMFSPQGGISEAAKREAQYYITGSLIGELYLRDIAISSLLERARISGYALMDLSHEDFADVITRCLQTARNSELTKVRVQDGKAAAFMANSYRIVPQPDIYNSASEKISSQFDGAFLHGAWNHSLSVAEYSVKLPMSDYEAIFKSKGMTFSEIMMTIAVMTSDTGYSGVNLFPAVVGIMPGGRSFKLPILGEISMNHKGKASITEFNSNLSLAFSQTEKTKTRLKELDSISLNYPFNCFCNLLKKVNITKKTASNILDQFAVTVGNSAPATATDVYFKACEIGYEVDQKDTIAVMTLEENISKILRLSNKAWTDFDRPVNCWSYNI